MLMSMLESAGMPIVSDGRREADEDNPRGYWEDERIKRLKKNDTWLFQAKGKAIKVVSPLLRSLPPVFYYRVLFMDRNLREVLESQKKMLENRGMCVSPDEDAELKKSFEKHLLEVKEWLRQQPNFECLYVEYSGILKQPFQEAKRVKGFLEADFDLRAMIAPIDEELYRNRVEDS